MGIVERAQPAYDDLDPWRERSQVPFEAVGPRQNPSDVRVDTDEGNFALVVKERGDPCGGNPSALFFVVQNVGEILVRWDSQWRSHDHNRQPTRQRATYRGDQGQCMIGSKGKTPV